MIIKVAGEKKEYPEGLTVKELIEKEDVETPQYVTVTINDEFVESGAFDSTEVKDGDEIEFMYFMGGGARYCHLQTNSWSVIPATSSSKRLVQRARRNSSMQKC